MSALSAIVRSAAEAVPNSNAIAAAKKTRNCMPFRVFFAAAIALLFGTASAADLTIALSADITSLDPHYVAAQPNINIGWHVFDALTRVDERARLIPGIAESWRAVNPTTWEFKLHKGVKF